MGSDPWFMGVYSLALSEVGDVESAARLAETALEARPDHGVVAHARAHIHFESGDVSAGRDFLRDWLATYSAGSLDGGHLTWHLALTYLALSEPGLALEVYRHQRTTNRTQALSLEDSVSLLWRLHLRGVDVSAEWSAVIDRRPSESPQRAFQLAHVAFAMAAQRDTDGLRRLTEEVTHAMTARPQEPLRYLLPLLDGLRLVALEQWADAAPALATAAVGALRLGGSNEQHTLFAETVAFAESHA
jgi:hypothetical protein